MRTLSLLMGGLLLAGGATWQVNLPAPLASHFDRLAAAESLTVDYTGRYLGEAAATIHLSMAKPNLFRLATPDSTIVCDGKTITTYLVKDKSYTEAPVTEEAIATFAARPEVRVWSAFLLKQAKADVLSAKAGGKRNVQGNEVSEVTVGMKNDTTGTLYVDSKLGVARGASLKTGAKEYLVLATKLELDKAAPAGEFSFVAPEGAKKVEPIKPGDASFASVQAIFNASCMPCHSSQNRRADIDLTNHRGAVSAVTPGNAAESRLVRSLKPGAPKRMPMNRAPLSDAQIAQIEAWVNAGAKP